MLLVLGIKMDIYCCYSPITTIDVQEPLPRVQNNSLSTCCTFGNRRFHWGLKTEFKVVKYPIKLNCLKSLIFNVFCLLFSTCQLNVLCFVYIQYVIIETVYFSKSIGTTRNFIKLRYILNYYYCCSFCLKPLVSWVQQYIKWFHYVLYFKFNSFIKCLILL